MPFKHIAQMALSIAAIAAAVFACSSADAKKGRDDLQEIVRSGSSTGGSGTSDGTSDDRVRHDSSSSSRADARSPAREANMSAVSPPCGTLRLYSSIPCGATAIT